MRNTPTHVGKTPSKTTGGISHRKHPHARGEDEDEKEYQDFKQETPPRTWGRRRNGPTTFSSSRNTPTHVGKTKSHGFCAMAFEKHPHARGEDGVPPAQGCYDEETPPRTWGRHCITQSGYGISRNTPTHVGKTVQPRKTAFKSQKHPHARGEDGRSSRVTALTIETPPRTWGRLAVAATGAGKTRNTPTHVGKTIS